MNWQSFLQFRLDVVLPLWAWHSSPVMVGAAMLQGLPAVSYSRNASQWRARQMVPDLLMIMLIAIYIIMTGFDVYASLKAQRLTKVNKPSLADVRKGGDWDG